MCLQTVVADNFDEDVMSSNKHVLILFHSPWCGECPEVEKMFVQLAKKVVVLTSCV
jgi:thioredoxin-like negative regulator of GroEL